MKMNILLFLLLSHKNVKQSMPTFINFVFGCQQNQELNLKRLLRKTLLRLHVAKLRLHSDS